VTIKPNQSISRSVIFPSVPAGGNPAADRRVHLRSGGGEDTADAAERTTQETGPGERDPAWCMLGGEDIVMVTATLVRDWPRGRERDGTGGGRAGRGVGAC